MRGQLLLMSFTAALVLGAPNVHGIVFSVDSESSLCGVTAGTADLLESFGGACKLKLTAAQIGLQENDDIDALHQFFHGSIPTWFSVDAASRGRAGTAVRSEADKNEVPGDIFSALQLGPGAGRNSRAADEGDLGLGDDDNLDAGHWSFFDPDQLFLFSLAPGSPSLGGMHSAADIFFSLGGQVDVWITAEELGLLPEDDIDALDLSEFFRGGGRYSLAPGSPSLGNNRSAADIFVIGGGHIMASALGLEDSDNIDALMSTFDCSLDVFSDCKVPEPATTVLVALGLLGFGLAGRRRRPRERA